MIVGLIVGLFITGKALRKMRDKARLTACNKFTRTAVKMIMWYMVR